MCGAGPSDRPFEEQHSYTSIAVVVSGTFQYRSPAGRELMTPGSFLLANAGDCFCCGHEHGVGDRCISFKYSPELFERLAFDAGRAPALFHVPRLPPLRELSPLVAKASLLTTGFSDVPFEELSIELVTQAIGVAHGLDSHSSTAEPGSLARVTKIVRMIEDEPNAPHELSALARMARLSPYHFLRTFQEITGTTPHQYVLRMRLRRAACRLRTEPTNVLHLALDCGFNDVGNFNRAFRAEFGVTPRAYRSAG